MTKDSNLTETKLLRSMYNKDAYYTDLVKMVNVNTPPHHHFCLAK